MIEVNEKKGFNFGFGVIPRFLWTGYGKSPERYLQLEAQLQRTAPDKFERVFERAYSEKTLVDGLIEIITNGNGSHHGPIQTVMTGLGIASQSLFGRGMDFYDTHIIGKITVDGETFEPNEALSNIYVSTFPSIYVGSPHLGLYPVPEAGREVGKMQAAFTSLRVPEIVLNVPYLMRGKHLPRSSYVQAREIRIETPSVTIAQLDGDFIFGREFVIRYDREINVIVPP